jgi:hypothetical protein
MSSISGTIHHAASSSYQFVSKVISSSFKFAYILCETLYVLFKSKVLGYSSNPPSLSIKQVSTELNPKQLKAATTIQRWYRKHLSYEKPETIEAAKKIMKLPESYLHYGKNTEDSYVETRWKKLQTFVHSLEKDHYVFAHSSSFGHSSIVDMREFLNGSLDLSPSKFSRWNTHKNFRGHKEQLPYKNLSEYLKSTLCKNINSAWTTDDNNRELILSCDANLNNKDHYESAYFYLKENKSWFSAEPAFIHAFFHEHLKNSHLCSFAKEEMLEEKNAVSSIKRGQGRLYLIAIEKKRLQSLPSCYVWRSHAFGRVCPAAGQTKAPSSDAEITAYHQDMVKGLDDIQKGTVKPHTHNGQHAQYRILPHNLDNDPTKKIFSLDSLTESQEKQHATFFWNLATLLKQCKRLEALSTTTSQEELLGVLLRTKFSLPEPGKKSLYRKFLDCLFKWFNWAFTKEALYRKGLTTTLKEKKTIFLQHQAYLLQHLPLSTLDELKKIGITLDLKVNKVNIAAGG